MILYIDNHLYINMPHFTLKSLSVALVVAFVSLSVLLIVLILLLGGVELLGYLRTSLIQGFGFGIAATALLFFFMSR